MATANELEEREDQSKSSTYESHSGPRKHLPGWLKVGAITAASVLAGGLAATWFYRKTVARLRQADQNSHDSDFGRNEERTSDEY